MVKKPLKKHIKSKNTDISLKFTDIIQECQSRLIRDVPLAKRVIEFEKLNENHSKWNQNITNFTNSKDFTTYFRALILIHRSLEEFSKLIQAH
jgi:formate dehydrogenase maturation protein FdhE